MGGNDGIKHLADGGPVDVGEDAVVAGLAALAGVGAAGVDEGVAALDADTAGIGGEDGVGAPAVRAGGEAEVEDGVVGGADVILARTEVLVGGAVLGALGEVRGTGTVITNAADVPLSKLGVEVAADVGAEESAVLALLLVRGRIGGEGDALIVRHGLGLLAGLAELGELAELAGLAGLGPAGTTADAAAVTEMAVMGGIGGEGGAESTTRRLGVGRHGRSGKEENGGCYVELDHLVVVAKREM